jgi:hypothetical protein
MMPISFSFWKRKKEKKKKMMAILFERIQEQERQSTVMGKKEI